MLTSGKVPAAAAPRRKALRRDKRVVMNIVSLSCGTLPLIIYGETMMHPDRRDKVTVPDMTDIGPRR
jgi:hypothetical protein